MSSCSSDEEEWTTRSFDLMTDFSDELVYDLEEAFNASSKVKKPVFRFHSIPEEDGFLVLCDVNTTPGPFDDPSYPHVGFWNLSTRMFSQVRESPEDVVLIGNFSGKLMYYEITQKKESFLLRIPHLMKAVFDVQGDFVINQFVPDDWSEKVILKPTPGVVATLNQFGLRRIKRAAVSSGPIGSSVPVEAPELNYQPRRIDHCGLSGDNVVEICRDISHLGRRKEKKDALDDITEFSHCGFYHHDNGNLVLSKRSDSSEGFIFINVQSTSRHFLVHSPSGFCDLTVKPLSFVAFRSGEFTMVEVNHSLGSSGGSYWMQTNKMDDLKKTRISEKTMNLSRFQFPDPGNLTGTTSSGLTTTFVGTGVFPSLHPKKSLASFNTLIFNSQGQSGIKVFMLLFLASVVMSACDPGEVERCGYCYLPALSSCTGSFQCDSGNCVSGICLAGQKPCPERVQCLNRYCDDSSDTCCTSQPNCPGDHTCVRLSGAPAGVCKKSMGSTCSDNSDCASGNCPPGGGQCFGPDLRPSVAYCCGQNLMASICPTATSTPTGSISRSITASVSSTFSSTPSMLATPVPSSVAPTTTAAGTTAPTAAVSPYATPVATTSPDPSSSCDKCHMATRNAPFNIENVESSSTNLQPSFPFNLFLKGVEAYPCKSGRFLFNLANTQEPGETISSNCTYPGCPYSYNPVVKAGFADPNIGSFDDCEPQRVPEVTEHRVSRNLLAFDEIYSIDLTDNLFTLTFSGGDLERIVTIQIQGEFLTDVCRSSVCFIAVDPELLTRSSKAVFGVIENGEVSSNKVIEIIGKRSCYIKDCWTCNLTNWSCIPKVFKALLIVTIILLSILIAYFLIKIGILSLACFFLMCKGFWVFGWGMFQIMKNKVTSLTIWFEESKKPILRSVVIFAMVSGVLCCEDSSVISGSLKSCEFTGISEQCLIDFEGLISLKGPGSKSCLIFSKDGNVFSQLEVEMTSNQITCDLADSYFTSSFTVHSSSKFHCQGALGSNCTSDCSSENLRTQSTYFDEVVDYLNFPGATTCSRQCSGIGCGCLLPTLGCVYTTFSYVPTGASMRVSRYLNCQNTPLISYKLTDSKGTVRSGIFSYEGGDVEDESILMNIATSLDRVPPADLPSHFCEGPKRGFCEASYKNSPLPGKVGDIQAESTADLNSGTFTVSDEIFLSYNHQNKYNKVVTRSPGFNTDFKSVPSFYSGLAWSVDNSGSSFGTKVFAFDTRPSPILVSIQILGNITVERTVTKVCPDLKFLNASGCYSCSSGYVAYFRSRSTCFPGTTLVESKTISPQIISLTKENSIVSLQGFTDDADLDDTLKVGNETVRFSSTLERGVELGQETILFTGEEIPAHVSFREGRWKWWEYLVASILMLLALLFLVSLIVFFVPLIPAIIRILSMARKRMKPKKEEVKPKPQEQRPNLRRRVVIG